MRESVITECELYLGVADEKELRMGEEFEGLVFCPSLLNRRIGHHLATRQRMSSISFTYLYQYFQVFKAHLEGLPNAGQLDECLEDGALEEFFIIDLPLKEGLSQAFALIGRQREGVVAEGRFPIDEDAVAIVEDTVLADGRHHRYGQLYAQRAHQDRSVKRGDEEKRVV